jgi:hypothetical protein
MARVGKASEVVTAMPIDDDKLYEEVGRVWQYFDSWREKIFAGYLSVLAALAFAFLKDPSTPLRAGVFAFAFVVSAVFWILDSRTTELLSICQAAGDTLAHSRGFYGKLNSERFAEKGGLPQHRYRRLWITGVSYGLAINALVASVSAASLVGCFVELRKWWNVGGFRRPAVAFVFAVMIFALLQMFTSWAWSREEKKYKDHISKTARGIVPPFLF